MRHRLASPLGLVTAVGTFFGGFALTGSLMWAVPLAVATALGVYLMVDDRTPVRWPTMSMSRTPTAR